MFRGWKSVLCPALLAVTVLAAAPAVAQSPQRPQVLLDTTYARPTGRTWPVGAGGDLQAALNAAQPGDVIVLQAGATYTGHFTLPYKSGAGWIYIESSALASLPTAGTRVDPGQASLMPKLVSPDALPTITTAAAAHHFRFVGVEITTAWASTGATNYVVVYLEAPGGNTALGQVPTDLVFDRTYIHGTPTGNVRRALVLNSARTAVVDSYLADCHELGADSQALSSWNGPGPFKIVNNYLEGAGENLLFGGADPQIANLVPADIEIRQNHIVKPLSWKVGHPSYAGLHWVVKNLLELKNAQRVLIDGNLLENNWADAQNGFAVLFTPRNQDGTAPWSAVRDVTFTNNIVRHTGNGLNMLGWDDIQASQQLQRVLIQNNLFTDVSTAWGGDGRLFQVLNNTAAVTIAHNTGLQTGNLITASYTTASIANTGFAFTNNIAPHNLYGVFGDYGIGLDLAAITVYFPGAPFQGNVVVGGNAATFPPGNFFPASLAGVGFTDLAGGNYALAAGGPYVRAGTDGKDVGVDFVALNAAMSSGGGPPPPPPPTLTVSMTAPASGATVATTVTASASATGAIGVQFKLDGANLGAEVTGTSYALAWDTTTALNGTHTLTAVARNAAGSTATSAPVSVTVVNTTPVGGAQNITWMSPANVTVTGNSLKKTGGCDGCNDAGAVSLQQIASGDGYAEFTATDATTLRLAGLTHAFTVSNPSTIDFGIRLQTGIAEVREAGVFRTDTPFVAGDVFRIAVQSGVVRYSKNGALLYTSAVAPTYPLFFAAALSNLNATIGNAVLAVGSASPPVTFTDGTAPTWTISTKTVVVKTVHVTELRSAINAARARFGLAAFNWTDPTLTRGVTVVRSFHFVELRTALTQAYQAAARTAPVFTDPTLVRSVTIVKTIQLNELRTAVLAL